ncbi:hypothetical protein [Cellulomonas cellasea]|uniref:Lipoprotein n=2 Tax=Cellulomonas cellasea TaxID=43670 RepID=A0A0A0BBF3_9CELL|nr:hypothetical protein [Cellulomonas cellasea]KGM03229.1 hypothetical protein Q760_08570 [Cellulomonas cellasea DSM 20118]GEA89800.1 hypothetical protein CCE01nite_37490 [Cellulomonas cellasea]
MTRRSPGRPARAALLTLLAVGSLVACTGPDPAPAPTTAPTASSAPSTPAATASEPAAPAPTADALTFHPEGRIDDFPPNAPEADVVAHLTERLGAGPETLDAEYACDTAGQPGRLLGWPGLRVFVLTSDPEGGETAPYVGGWSLLDEEGGDPASATAEGLRIGDPEDRVAELYPSAVNGEPSADGQRWWYTRDDGGYTVIASDEGAGAVVGAIGSGFLCIAS